MADQIIDRMVAQFDGDDRGLQDTIKRVSQQIDGLQDLLVNMGSDADESFDRASSAANKFANRTIAAFGSSFRSALTGDFASAIGSVNDLAADALKMIPEIGQGLSSAYKDVTGAMMEAVETGFAFNDSQKRAQAGFTLTTGDARKAREEITLYNRTASQFGFGREQIYQAAQTLELMSRNGGQVPLMIQGIVNAARGLNRGEAAIDGLAGAFARIIELDKVGTRDMRMLIRQGLPVYDLLAEQLGTSKQKVEQLMNKGVMDAQDFVTLMAAALNSPKWQQAAKTAADTFDVQNRRIASGLAALKGEAAQPLYNTTLTGLNVANDALRGPNAHTIAAGIAAETAPAAAVIQTTLKALQSGDVFGSAVKTGESLIDGFKQGALAKISDAVGVAKSLVSSVMDFVVSPEGFDINSPSKKMVKIGGSIGEGFQQGALQSLDDAQKEIVKKIIEIGQRMGATIAEIKAALATAWAESKFRNLAPGQGDRDSVGVMQQRPSQGWGTAAQLTDPGYAITQFYNSARRRDHGQAPEQLAQSVQRSAYPERYAAALPLVENLLQSLSGGATIKTEDISHAWEVLKAFAEARGFTVTSTTGGGHNVGSAHYQGRAADVRTRDHAPAEVAAFMAEARAAGIAVRDERTRPPGQRVWGGPHVHLQVNSQDVLDHLLNQDLPAFSDQIQRAVIALEPLANLPQQSGFQILQGLLSGASGGSVRDFLRPPADEDFHFATINPAGITVARELDQLSTTAIINFKQVETEIAKGTTDLAATNQQLATANQQTNDVANKYKGIRLTLREMKLDFKDMGDLFESSFNHAFTDTKQGFKGMVREFGLDLAQGLEQNAVQTLSSKLRDTLFGTGQNGNKGLIGKVLGWFGLDVGGGGTATTQLDATNANTTSTDANTVALNRLNATMETSGDGESGGGGGGLLGKVLGFAIGALAGGLGGSKGDTFSGGDLGKVGAPHADGGLITGPGSATSDNILTPTSPGEYVTRAAAVSYYGESYFRDLNQLRVPRDGQAPINVHAPVTLLIQAPGGKVHPESARQAALKAGAHIETTLSWYTKK